MSFFFGVTFSSGPSPFFLHFCTPNLTPHHLNRLLGWPVNGAGRTPPVRQVQTFSLIMRAGRNLWWHCSSKSWWHLGFSRWWQLKYFWNVHPENWGRWTHFDQYFSKGLVQPPTSSGKQSIFIQSWLRYEGSPVILVFGGLVGFDRLTCPKK